MGAILSVAFGVIFEIGFWHNFGAPVGCEMIYYREAALFLHGSHLS